MFIPAGDSDDVSELPVADIGPGWTAGDSDDVSELSVADIGPGWTA